ncbi:MAG: RluA family pseudouridine synthase [Bacteroidota bacterium]
MNPTRLSDYAVGIFPQIPSRKGIKKAIKRGEIHCNGIVGQTGTWVKGGDQLTLVELDEKPRKIYQLALDIVYEDDELAVILKPAGLLVSGNQFHTVQNALPFNLQPSESVDAYQLPKPIHRLDHATSGLLLVAKTRSAHQHLAQQFKEKTIQKKYQAIVVGQPKKPEGAINEPIDGKEAHTFYKVVKTVPSLKVKHLSLMNLFPQTGRTHQLRIHLADLGHPILGDTLYHGDAPLLKGKGLFLCAVALTFIHPKTGKEVRYEIDAPAKFEYRLAQEERRFLQ